MFDYACVYSPDLGDDEHVERQLVFTRGAVPAESFVKLIGVAQGIAELAHSFDHASPAKWFRTGRGAAAKLVLIVPLANSSSDWRSGFWFAGQLPAAAATAPADALYRHVRLAYERAHFLGGPPQADRWPDLTAAEPADLCSTVAPEAMRLAPGALSPTARAGIEEVRVQARAADVLITSIEDGSAVWPGEHLGLDLRICIQRWLARDTERVAAGQSSQGGAPTVPIGAQPGAQDGAEGAPDEVQEGAQDGASDGPEGAERAPNEAQEGAQDGTSDGPEGANGAPNEAQQDRVEGADGAEEPAEAEPTREAAPSVGSWLSMPDISKLSAPYMPSMPSMPSLPSMPAVPAMNTYMPSALRAWWDSADARAAPSARDEAAFVCADLKVFEPGSGRAWYVTGFRRALFVYFLVFAEPVRRPPSSLTGHFEQLAAQLEGFSFAFAPPTRFNYLILNRRERTVTSTFPNTLATEILGTLLAPPAETPQVVRVGPTWLYFVRVKDGIDAVFGKRGVSSQHGSLLGALHSDVQQWLSDYERRLP